jgi:glycosyltransferase involved in cell wall biosynthesis
MGGGTLRNWQNINIMMKFGEVAVFAVCQWTEKNISLPGVTLVEHCNVANLRSTREKIERRLWWLRLDGHPDTDYEYAKAAAQKLEKTLETFQPDIVVIAEAWLYRYIPVVKRYKCKIIFDNHNIEAVLFLEKKPLGIDFKSKLKAQLQLTRLKHLEGELIHKANQAWVCSQEDAAILQQYYGKVAHTHVIPNAVNIDYYQNVRSQKCNLPPELKSEQQNILFLGQLSYLPNIVAVDLLIEQIYPQLKAIYPNCRLILAGRNPTQKMQAAGQEDPGIIVTGRIPDVRPYLAAASVLVVPLLQGGGTRLKILEAFAAGCPVISTAKGAEGLEVRDGVHLLIRNNVADIVSGICQLWLDPLLATKLINSAYQIVKTEYSWEAVEVRIKTGIRKLQ